MKYTFLSFHLDPEDTNIKKCAKKSATSGDKRKRTNKVFIEKTENAKTGSPLLWRNILF